MPDEHSSSVLFRAYIRRKPSGLILVTVLSAALPRPVFRSYPLDIGEAAAVERSVGHAVQTLINALPAAIDENASKDRADRKQAKEHAFDVKNELRHGSPHGLHQPREHAAVRSEEQEGAEGYAVKQHLRLRVVWQGLL